jgi:hypothetical protein
LDVKCFITLGPGYCVISVLSDRESKGQTDGQAKNTYTKGKIDEQGNAEREREIEGWTNRQANTKI